MKLSIIIPMYNEEKNVAGTVDALLEAARIHPWYATEIVLVNDGSQDNTASEAAKAAEADGRIIADGYPENHGKGYAVRYGMLKAGGELRVFTDCDLAYGTEALYKMADMLFDKHKKDEKVGVCIGSRNLSPEGYEGYTFLRRVMSKTYLKVISVAAGFKHSDSQSGIKCFTAQAAQDVFSRCEVDRFAFDLEALMFAEKLGYKVTEMAVKVINHNESASKVNPVRDTLRMLRDIKQIKKRVNGSKA